MATIVRDTGKQTGSAVSEDSASFGALPAVGNHIIIGSAMWHGTDPTMLDCSDNQSHAYVEDIERADGLKDSGASLYSTKVATSSGTFTVTVNPNGNVWIEWIAFEVSGLDATTHLDKTGSSADTTGSANATASAANSTASGIAVAVASVGSGDTDINIGDTPPSGYTALATNEDANATQGFQLAYKIYSSSETSSAAFTHDAATLGWTCVIATYKDASTGSSITPPQGNLALSTIATLAPLQAHLRNPAQGNLALSATAPTALRAHLQNPAQSNLALSTVAPSALQAHLRNPAQSNLVLSSTAPSVSVDASGTNISPAQGNLALSTVAPTRLVEHLQNPAQANLALSGTAPTVSVSQPGINISVTVANADLRLTSERPALATTIVSFGWTYTPITTNATSFVTTSATPTNGRLYILGVMSSHATAPTTPTVTGGGMTWVQIATQTISTTHRVTLFRALVTSGATTGALTIDFAGVTQTGGGAWCYEIEHAENSGENGGNAILQIAQGSTAAASAFDAAFALAWRANSVGVATIGRTANTGMTPRASWSETQDAGYASPGSRVTQHQRVTADTAIGVTDTTDTRGGVGVEIQNKANGGSKSLAPIAAMLALSTFGSSLGLGINPAHTNLSLSSTSPTVQVSESVSVQPGPANLALSSTAPSVYQEHLRYPAQGNIVLSATAPTIGEGIARDTLQGNLALSTAAPNALQSHLANPTLGNLALSTTAPSALLAHLANPAQGNLALSSTAPTVLQAHLANTTLGNLALSSTAPDALQSHLANPALGNLVLSATAPTVSVDGTGTNISPAQGNLALSTVAPTTLLDHLAAPARADLVLSAAAPTALQSHLALPAVGNLTLSTVAPAALHEHLRYPAHANLVLSSSAPSLGGAVSVNPEAGELALSAAAPTVTQTHLAYPSQANLALSTTAPALSVNVQRDTPQGALALSTTAPATLQAHLAYPGQGALALSAEAPNLGSGLFVTPTTVNLTLSSVKPSLDAGIAPTLGNLTLTTSAPSVVVPTTIIVTTGNLVISSESPTRVVASGSHIIAAGRVRLMSRAFGTDIQAYRPVAVAPRESATDLW